MQNILSNNEIRKQIYAGVLQTRVNLNSKDSFNYYELYANDIQKLQQNPIGRIIYSGIISVVFLDAYKVLNLKLKLSGITNEEKDLFDLLNSIGSYTQLLENIYENETLFQKMLPYTIEFCEMDFFRKIMCVESLNFLQKDFLCLYYEIFENDLDEYSKYLTIDTIGDYCKQVIELAIKMDDTDIALVEDNLTDQLEGFLRFLVGNNIDKYINLMSDMIRLDYKWNKYFEDKSFIFDDEENNLYIKQRLDVYEDNTENDLVINECLEDEEYLLQILASFLSIKCYNMNMNDKVINQDIIDDHFKDGINKNLLR